MKDQDRENNTRGEEEMLNPKHNESAGSLTSFVLFFKNLLSFYITFTTLRSSHSHRCVCVRACLCVLLHACVCVCVYMSTPSSRSGGCNPQVRHDGISADSEDPDT